MSLMYPGEFPLYQFQAEICQPPNINSEYLQATPRPQTVILKFPLVKKFDAQILITTARVFIFEPTQTDFIRQISLNSTLKETLYQQFFITHIMTLTKISGQEIIIDLISPLRIIVKFLSIEQVPNVFDYLKQKSAVLLQGSDFVFWKGFMALNTTKQIIKPTNFPPFTTDLLTLNWNSYFDMYQQIKQISITGSDLDDVLNAPINSDLSQALRKQFESFHAFKLPTLKINQLLPLKFLENLQPNTTGITLSVQNLHYELCESYSAIFATPDVNLSKPSMFENSRFPILSFSRILRCGKLNSNCDYELFRNVLKCTNSEKLIILNLGTSFQPRSSLQFQIFSPIYPSQNDLLTSFNSLYHSSSQTDPIAMAKKIDFSAQNIVELMTSQQQLIKTELNTQFHVKNELSNWPKIVRQTLQVATKITQIIDPKTLVLVSGSDERQLGSVIICLSEILINSKSRTVKGLQQMIWKHLVQPGFVFDLPLLILLNDCIDFCIQKCPKSFHFSRAFLAKYFCGLAGRQTGEFCFRSELEKVVLGVTLTTQLLEVNAGVEWQGEIENIGNESAEWLEGVGRLGWFWSIFGSV
ncbi:Myotubularin-like phosphatase domain-containing protein [Spironucleus salmonicida]|uniref:Myotubularin-like phosphatase domain-containing protein n=1 Tax=Spironucleus salmonicida TaxID=348837 RepID=V6LBG5_9EUKA|nr:Myotubularin-like phosphatase domain-containing protein [Spironucleus salmonicida]|eukprot:EST41752.1 hypothetical protein SS50377_18585 [Spironucleus salmonicida]